MSALEITVFAKQGGPLTKTISLTADGAVKSDGSACVMSSGTAHRFKFDSIQQLGTRIEKLAPHEAIALGRLRPDLPDRVEVVTKRKLNGAARSDLIARTQDFIAYQPGQPALALIDFDKKGMPAELGARIEKMGGSGRRSCRYFQRLLGWRERCVCRPAPGCIGPILTESSPALAGCMFFSPCKMVLT